MFILIVPKLYDILLTMKDCQRTMFYGTNMNTNKPICKTNLNGDKVWYLNGKLHREDGPAIDYDNGDKVWYLNGNCHREDGPAIERANGYKAWYLSGKLHREDDDPAVERPEGDKAWYLNGQLHRENGPAIEYVDGDKAWYLNDNQYPREKYYKELHKRGILPKEQCFLELI